MLDAIKPPDAPVEYSYAKPKSHFRWWLGLGMLLLLMIGIFVGSKLVILAQKIFEGEENQLSFRQFFIAPDKKLSGETRGEIRLLLMGIGGEKHDGGTLTDTMILATLQLPRDEGTDTKVSLVSIPRDLVVYIPGYDYRKINSAYAFGESGGRRQGAKLAVQTVEQILDTDIPYYAVIDFAGFKKIIDDLSGIEIEVERGFTDAQYPDEQGGYLPPITFAAGRQKMDGDRALQFVRSRHGNNGEASDFARARRQQLLLKALKNKATSLRVLTNLSLIDRLLDDLADHVRTNLRPHELKRLYGLTKSIENKNIRSLTIGYEGGLLCDVIADETGAYVLVPCAGLGKYEALRELIQNQFLAAALQEEQPIIEIQNASGIGLLGQRVQSFLNLPLLKTAVSNYQGEAAYQEGVIYDNTRGQKPETLAYLQKTLGLRVAQSPFPFPTTTEKPDFVIVATADLQEKIP